MQRRLVNLTRQLHTATSIMGRSPETASFKFNHTMLRIRDPAVSLKFYQDVMGMELIDQHDGGDFTLYFLAFDHGDGTQSAQEKKANRFNREGILELTHNHGTEKDSSFKGYASGNEEPGKGFGHIAVTCDNLEERHIYSKVGVQFKKRPEDGKMRHIAFIYDPDKYWIELVANSTR